MKRLLRIFMFTFFLALTSLLSVSVLWSRPVLLTEILIVISVFALMSWRSIDDILLYVVVGVVGAIGEAFAIAYGAWNYSYPNILAIPYWLPFLWGIAALFIKRISLEIHDFVRSKALNGFDGVNARI